MTKKDLYECAATFLILPPKTESKRDEEKKEKIRKVEPTYCGMSFWDYCEQKQKQKNYP